MRDGQWKVMAARELVPGDLIKINMGDIIAADGKTIPAAHMYTPSSNTYTHQ